MKLSEIHFEDDNSNKKSLNRPTGRLTKFIISNSGGLIKSQSGANFLMWCVVFVSFFIILSSKFSEYESKEDLKKYIFDPNNTTSDEELYEKRK